MRPAVALAADLGPSGSCEPPAPSSVGRSGDIKFLSPGYGLSAIPDTSLLRSARARARTHTEAGQVPCVAAHPPSPRPNADGGAANAASPPSLHLTSVALRNPRVSFRSPDGNGSERETVSFAGGRLQQLQSVAVARRRPMPVSLCDGRRGVAMIGVGVLRTSHAGCRPCMAGGEEVIARC
jgi:hypothetical protein